MICFSKKECKHPKWIEWCNKSEDEAMKIAEKNEWYWYFDWLEIGDNLRYHYEKADKDPKVANKYNGYDRWYEKHKTEYSYVYLGTDACFHKSDKPIRQWTVYNPCTNKDCPYNQGKYANSDECGYFGSNEQNYDCFNDLFASIQAFIDVCGIEDLDTFAKDFNIHEDIIGWFKYGDKYFKEMKTMSKPFWVALSELKSKDEISVYWTNGMMYINDENDGQASTNTSLFQAYRFASLIESPIFDYTASDEEVKEFQKELLEFYRDDFSEEEQELYIIDVWEYLDNIADDYKKLTGVTINDIDIKRAIVSYMSETDWENNCAMGFGSGTYIARVLSDHIIGNDYNQIKGCNNPLAIELAEIYLQTDDYSLKGFAKALKEATQYKMNIPNNFDQYLVQSSRISYKCYSLLGYLLKNNIKCKKEFLVGYIDWFGDYEINERYIYCHIDSSKNEIYFQENRKAPKSAYLHDIAFPHLVSDPNRIQKDIEIKFTEQYIDDILKEINDGCVDEGYTHCHMYGTVGSYTG